MNRREAIAALVSLPATARVSVAQLQPSDVIVLECDGHLSLSGRARLLEQLQQVWPAHRCVVLGAGMKLRVLSQSVGGER